MSGVAALIGGAIVLEFGFRYLFLIMIFFSFGSFFVLVFFWHRPADVLDPQTVELENLKNIRKDSAMAGAD
ncbi:MAG: hypothetical protein A2599_01500 [Candidatus Staskawiczbacteria bacterium RIFOXYD1_FULL_39_28]|uniref:Major facilitator superfamily (MFS) profile domain-containing protein n=1 Tax=Candidatus Staskawiczbacteria bacterium RIFOXYC1_FULL_38_18 TaxID=1802229 RepID=A0A1G2JB32_9BACT|nr:MAG: hypothetical protein A2401_00240 [Candidatus Staskawiczbacteria bacterium RIFOXYC1_FULL_38_18]OGZ91993.1 MAG: hypothetical protein A2599_01500 [Candidatus Staskawiczbacteria bacterium RIFOXYD1_FULL_39_28]